LGGTFDPIHMGHLSLASKACSEFGLNRLLIMPSGRSYMKSASVSSARFRGEMVKAALSQPLSLPCFERFEYDDREIRRGGCTYTCDTIRELDEEYGREWDFYFIIGGDTLLSLRSWKDISVTLDRCIILVADRGNDEKVLEECRSLKRDHGADIRFIESFESMDISSTQIRSLLAEGKGDTAGMLPVSVREYIDENGLYLRYSREFIADIEERVKRKQKESRFRHTLGVAFTASCLAMRYGADVEKAYLAGILHDNAKHFDDEKMLAAAHRAGIKVSEFEKRNAFILHGPVGAYRAREKFGIYDKDILNAVENHTVGRVGMSILEEIIFIADYIEYGRDKAKNLDIIRRLAFEDIGRCMYKILSDTADYIKSSGAELDERMLQVLEYYKNREKE